VSRAAGRTVTLRLPSAPFPFDGVVPETGQPFFDATDPATGERLHTTAQGTRYAETRHYRDDRVLVHVAADLAAGPAPVLVVFFHGHLSVLARDVIGRMSIPQQIDGSGRAVILIAPQLAVDAMDSSPGRLWLPGALARLLDDVAVACGRWLGLSDPEPLRRAPVVLAAFSGGYKALAMGLDRGGVADRVAGIILLDAVFGAVDRFAAWAAAAPRAFLAALYSRHTRAGTLALAAALDRHGVAWSPAYPEALAPSARHLVPCATPHPALPVDGPPRHPLGDLLRRADMLPRQLDAALQHRPQVFAALHKN